MSRLDTQRHAVQDLAGDGLLEAGDTLQRGQRHLCRRGIPEPHVVELDGDRPAGQRDGGVGVDDRRFEVEHLEHPLEADQRRHDVDLDVGDRGQRPVQPVEVGGQGDERADAERAGDRHGPTDPVDERNGQRGQQPERGHHDARVHRRRDADVAHPSGAGRETLGLGLRSAEELHEQRTGHVEALGHHLAHLAVEAVLLSRDVGQPLARPPGREHEQRQEDQRQQRDRPGQDEHRAERRHDGEHVADDAGERRREGLLGTLHVGVEAGDEGAGLGPAEEPDRHALDVVEHLGAEVVDEPLTDARREPALGEAVGGGQHGEPGDEPGEADDQAGAALLDALVDDRLVDQRGRRTSDRVDDDEQQEQRDGAAIRRGERSHATERVRAQPVVGDGAVLGERADLVRHEVPFDDGQK